MNNPPPFSAVVSLKHPDPLCKSIVFYTVPTKWIVKKSLYYPFSSNADFFAKYGNSAPNASPYWLIYAVKELRHFATFNAAEMYAEELVKRSSVNDRALLEEFDSKGKEAEGMHQSRVQVRYTN